jgi:hypothetical protein
MLDRKLAGVCGVVCSECKYLGDSCEGCGYVEGKPFWTREFNIEVCPIYDCCKRVKQQEHCGTCEEFPCKTFKELKDPSMSPEEAEINMLARMEELWKRKDVGDDAWLKEKE